MVKQEKLKFWSVRVYLADSADVLKDLDALRRSGDRLGRPGIEAKRSQTDRRVLKKGYLRMQFKTRETAIEYQKMIKSDFPKLPNRRFIKRRER